MPVLEVVLAYIQSMLRELKPWPFEATPRRQVIRMSQGVWGGRMLRQCIVFMHFSPQVCDYVVSPGMNGNQEITISGQVVGIE